jgi:RNA polymerase sigma factor (sigma-70 family)
VATVRQRLVAGQLRTLYQLGAIGDLSDRQLLERFNSGEADHAELAFAALVERHGPMVLRVCSALLRNPHDAQDVFQATFLVLLRKAGALWIHDSLGPWLHRVAKRLAVQVEASARRRRAFERRAAESRGQPIARASGSDGGCTVLHEEIDRLPERYRIPVILCHLEGQSQELAARALRLPVGTVKSRLHRARDLLRARLARRGAAFSAALLTAELSSTATAAALSSAISPSLFGAAVRSGMARAGESGLISLRTVHLVEEAIKSMFLTKIRNGVAVALLAGCLAIGAAGVFAQQGPGQETGRAKPSSSDTVRAEAAGHESGSQFIRQSRKMVVERLEQELAAARERVDRTIRKVKSSTDPELLLARRTADRLAGLLARIDGVLVEAVNEFPTMFDFTSSEADDPSRPSAQDIRRRDAGGKPDVELVVSEPKRVLDLGGITTFRIRLRNYGNNVANGLQVRATLSDNLEVQEAVGGATDLNMVSTKKHAVMFHQIDKLGPGAEMVLGIRAKAVSGSPKLATCRVAVTYEGLPDAFEDMAGVKVTAGRGATAETDGASPAPTAASDQSAKTPPLALSPFYAKNNYRPDVNEKRAQTQFDLSRAMPSEKPADTAAGPAYDGHSLAKAAERLEWSKKMRAQGYVSKGQYDQELANYEALKARLDSDIARAADRADWAKKMFEKGYVTKSQYDAEILKHYDLLKARLEGPSVSDEVLARYEDLKRRYETKPKDPGQQSTPSTKEAKPADVSQPES